jgi:N-hydroxyarylamine O-acetyltransferase
MLDLDSYLRRIDYRGRLEPTLETLRALQLHHASAIPFENLDTLLGTPVKIDLESLQRKLVQARRGGYCFEHNVLFQSVLGAVGLRSTALAARVTWERPDDELRARTHMVLLVEIGATLYLADVGFGGLTPTGPLALQADVEQATPHELFRVVREAAEFAVEARVRAQWKRLYRFDLQAQQPVDIELLNHYVVSHADSPMIGRFVAARAASQRRFGLLNGVLREHRVDGTSEERRIGSVAELREVLRTTFGIDAPQGAASDAALARVIG